MSACSSLAYCSLITPSSDTRGRCFWGKTAPGYTVCACSCSALLFVFVTAVGQFFCGMLLARTSSLAVQGALIKPLF